jgi:hypothetical protein
MKQLRDYLAESEQWMQSPADGDNFAIELDDGTLVETYIIEVADDCILLDATPEIISAISEWATLEDTDEGDSGVILETMGYGSLVGEEEMDEAEYQGRKVPLGKPMRGDTKKFKVYVKDPATGNVKKVNFGHGGTTAKRLGQKTMKIKKSNPARRKSFRARHNCDNPGPRTKARYWSCRAW